MSHADPVCADFRDMLPALARDVLHEPDRERCLRHTADCASCSARLARERALTAALSALAETDESREASGALEQSLRERFREVAGFTAPRSLSPEHDKSPGQWRAVAAAFAAGLALASIASGPSLSDRNVPRPVEAAEVGPDGDPSAFIPLVYGEPLAGLDAVQVVRVRLQRAALASFGLPATGNPDAPAVDADVLLGHDGVARGIRFVTLTQGGKP